MTPGTNTDTPGPHLPTPPSAAEQTVRWHHLLRNTCGHLGMAPQDADRILSEEALQVGGIHLALRLNAPVQQGEFYADCGMPAPWQEADVYRHLLEDALVNDMPAISVALHPQSRHIVARACLPLPTLDDEGWLCTAMLLATATRAFEIREKFALPSDGHA